ncbi:MAG: flagellar biosynthetic protein FliR, partial [Kiritimatiellae bacterium]|nr:flagellar biosynthetic protein FliR [Kiritimatiellia bacterium]
MPYVEFHRWILAAVLAMARFGGAFAICPALTESMIPGIARRAAVLGFSCLAIPFIKNGMPPGEPNVWMFALLAFKEAFIGFLIGFFAAIPF